MKVFVSSTTLDLAEHRAAAVKALQQLGHEVIEMSTWPAGTEPPLGKVLSEVARADAWIGLFAWRYGDIPKAKPQRVVLPKDGKIGQTSITHWEYLKAKEKKIPIIPFLLAEDHPWPPHLIDGFVAKNSGKASDGTDLSNVRKLREEFQAERVVAYFTEPSDLEAKVSAAITVTGMSRQVSLNIAPELSISLTDDSTMDGGIKNLAINSRAMQVSRIDLGTVWWSTRIFLTAYIAEALTEIRWIAIVNSTPPIHEAKNASPFVGLIPTNVILRNTEHLPPEVRKFTTTASRRKKSTAGNATEVQALLELWDQAFSKKSEAEVTNDRRTAFVASLVFWDNCNGAGQSCLVAARQRNRSGATCGLPNRFCAGARKPRDSRRIPRRRRRHTARYE